LLFSKLVVVRGVAPTAISIGALVVARPLPVVSENEVDSMWAITGKQYWRCGVIRKPGYGVLLLAHLDPTKDVVC